MIREIIRRLLPDDRKALYDAFDNVIPHFVQVDETHFIGVHLDNIKYLETEEEEGYFTYGKINKEKPNG